MRATALLLCLSLTAAAPTPCAAPPGTIPAVPEALCYKEIVPAMCV